MVPQKIGKLAFFFIAYLGQHTPVGFIWLALPVIFRDNGVSLSRIGLVGLLYTPWALKFLYAPVVDRVALPFIKGRKRAWIILSRTLALLCLVFLSFFPPDTEVFMVFCLVLMMNTAFALGDIALDGAGADMFEPWERTWGAGIQMTGNFTGFMVGGGLFLIVFQYLGWAFTLRGLTLFLLILSLPLWFLKEKQNAFMLQNLHPRVDVKKFVGSTRTCGFFIFLICMALALKSGYQLRLTLLHDIGFSPRRIGNLMLWAGSPVAIAGTFLGSFLSRHVRAGQLFAWGCTGAALVAAMSWALATGISHSLVMIVLTMGTEQLLMGTLMTGIYSLILGASAGPQSSTNFGILCGVQHLTTFAAVFLGGWAGQHLGYRTVFALLTLLCVILIIPVRALFFTAMKHLDRILLLPKQKGIVS